MNLSAKYLLIGFFLIESISSAQTLFPDREAKIKQLRDRPDIIVTEIEPGILRIQYPGGKSIFKNINDFKPSRANRMTYSPTFDSTIIDLRTIDTTLYYQKYSFWQEVPISSLNYEPMVGDINKNGLPEIYGQRYNSDTSRITVMEMNSQEEFISTYNYDSAQIVKSIYDIDKDGGKELLLSSNGILGQYPGNCYLFYRKQSDSSLANQLSFIFYRFGGQQENNYFGDWDGDNYTDWIFVNLFWGSQSINIYEYNPVTNIFDSVYNYAIGNNPYGGFAIGDFDNDGKTEFLGGNIQGDVVSIENNGDNSYDAVWNGEVETYNAYLGTQTNDLDGNGKEEIWIAGDAFYNGEPRTRITLFEASGNNNYSAVGIIDFIGVFSTDAGNIQSLDVDKDGKDEVMICIDGNVIILKFAGGNNDQKYKVFYIKQNNQPGITYYGATMYDINSDGKEEIIISMQNYPVTGHRLLSDIFKPDTITNVVREVPETPRNYFLYQNYPNPFNPSTRIKFTLSSESKINIKIYNTLGEEIRELLNETRISGEYETTWNGTDSYGNRVPSGIYFITMEANGLKKGSSSFRKTIKSVLVK